MTSTYSREPLAKFLAHQVLSLLLCMGFMIAAKGIIVLISPASHMVAHCPASMSPKLQGEALKG